MRATCMAATDTTVTARKPSVLVGVLAATIVAAVTLFIATFELSMADFPLVQLRSAIQQHLRPPVTRQGLKIVFSHATDHTGCRGACLAAERCFGGEK